jgi:hypothetical protein
VIACGRCDWPNFPLLSTFDKAHKTAYTPKLCQNSYRATGLFPLDITMNEEIMHLKAKADQGAREGQERAEALQHADTSESVDEDLDSPHDAEASETPSPNDSAGQVPKPNQIRGLTPICDHLAVVDNIMDAFTPRSARRTCQSINGAIRPEQLDRNSTLDLYAAASRAALEELDSIKVSEAARADNEERLREQIIQMKKKKPKNRSLHKGHGSLDAEFLDELLAGQERKDREAREKKEDTARKKAERQACKVQEEKEKEERRVAREERRAQEEKEKEERRVAREENRKKKVQEEAAKKAAQEAKHSTKKQQSAKKAPLANQTRQPRLTTVTDKSNVVRNEENKENDPPASAPARSRAKPRPHRKRTFGAVADDNEASSQRKKRRGGEIVGVSQRGRERRRPEGLDSFAI